MIFENDILKKFQPLFDSYYRPGSKAAGILIKHSICVMKKCLSIAQKVKYMNPDYQFIAEAALLHDIGICRCHAPNIGCYGKFPYIAHGYLGREILEKARLHKHALVCERHVGVGISKSEIIQYNLPLPIYDMLPTTLEEKIICYADKFFTKSKPLQSNPLSVERIIEYLSAYGTDKANVFKSWADIFESIKDTTPL